MKHFKKGFDLLRVIGCTLLMVGGSMAVGVVLHHSIGWFCIGVCLVVGSVGILVLDGSVQ